MQNNYKKQLGLGIITILLLLGCKKDDIEYLSAPQINWNAVEVNEDLLTITIDVAQEKGDLPEGILGLKLDGEKIAEFSKKIGSQKESPLSFTDNEEHNVELFYSITDNDEIQKITKRIIRKEESETINTEVSDWYSY